MPAKVLVIEDDDASLELVRYLLETRGHRVLAARDGAEGFRMFVDHEPDLVVCDLRLPELDGFQVLERIRAQAELGRLPVIAVTAFAMVGDRHRVSRAGFDGYITKPIDPQNLVDQLETYLSRHEKHHGKDSPRR